MAEEMLADPSLRGLREGERERMTARGLSNLWHVGKGHAKQWYWHRGGSLLLRLTKKNNAVFVGLLYFINYSELCFTRQGNNLGENLRYAQVITMLEQLSPGELQRFPQNKVIGVEEEEKHPNLTEEAAPEKIAQPPEGGKPAAGASPVDDATFERILALIPAHWQRGFCSKINSLNRQNGSKEPM